MDEKRWIKLNTFPESVGKISGMCEINNVFYVVGHRGISTLKNEVYEIQTNKACNWCATCRVGNNILVICKDYYDDVEISLFNPINKQWRGANINTKRLYFAVVYYRNKVWIVGGCERDDGKSKKLNTIEVYDAFTKNQVLSPIKMNEARSSHKIIVYKKKLFVFGGCGKDDKLLNSVEMFSPENQKFVMMAPMKIARYSFACYRVGNLVYVIGGWIPYGRNSCCPTKSAEVYNLDSNTWTDAKDFPVGGNTIYACAINDKL